MTTETTSFEPSQVVPPYPVRLEILRPERQSRLTNFPLAIGTFIREILLIPNFIVVFFVAIVALLLYFIATFAILFTGRFPLGMYNFVAGYLRWTFNVYSYFFSLHDKYPPFSTEQQTYPVIFVTDYPERSSRLLNFPIIGLYVKEILLIPHLVVLFFLFIALFVVVFIAKFAILFTGSFPAGMHRFCVGVFRWWARTSAYLMALTDRYPPFSLS